MSAEDLRTVFYAVALIALTVFGVYSFARYGVPALYRRLHDAEPPQMVIAGAFVILAGLGLFPPWNFTFQEKYAARSARPAPRALIFLPPSPQRGAASYGVAIDIGRLTVEWLAVGALAAAAWIVLRAWHPAKREDEKRSEVRSAQSVPATSQAVRPEVVQALVEGALARLAGGKISGVGGGKPDGTPAPGSETARK